MTLQSTAQKQPALTNLERMNETPETTRTERVLVIAGYDPSGGAGLDVDQRAAEDLFGKVECVATAFTDQTSEAVTSIGARNAEIWADEVRSIWNEAGGFSVVKFGLLPGEEHVRAAARLIREWRAEREVAVIVDPVIRSSSGHEFLDADGCRSILRELLPRGIILTPNLPELAQLTGNDLNELVEDLDLRARAGRDLADLGASTVVVKGGHGGEDPVCDILIEPGKRASWRTHERIMTENGPASLRGTGCRFATALAVGLSSGLGVEESVDQEGRYVASCIAESHGKRLGSAK
jgi:hydroxymethylpyrimidine/phosphomethylpyrimidine kinase